MFVNEFLKMSFIISGQDAYDIYEHLGLRKAKKKSASYETVETILKSKNVEIKPKPSDPVSLNLKKLINQLILKLSSSSITTTPATARAQGERA